MSEKSVRDALGQYLQNQDANEKRKRDKLDAIKKAQRQKRARGATVDDLPEDAPRRGGGE